MHSVASDASISKGHTGADAKEQFNANIRADSSDGGNPGEAGINGFPKARSLFAEVACVTDNHTDLCPRVGKHGGPNAARLRL